MGNTIQCYGNCHNKEEIVRQLIVKQQRGVTSLNNTLGGNTSIIGRLRGGGPLRQEMQFLKEKKFEKTFLKLYNCIMKQVGAEFRKAPVWFSYSC